MRVSPIGLLKNRATFWADMETLQNLASYAWNSQRNHSMRNHLGRRGYMLDYACSRMSLRDEDRFYFCTATQPSLPGTPPFAMRPVAILMLSNIWWTKGADMDAKDHKGGTPLTLATKQDMVEFLKQHGAKEQTSTSHAP